MGKLFHIKYMRSTDEREIVKSANVSALTLKRIKLIPWIDVLNIEPCIRPVRESKILL